jgi:hypothetical protein
MLLTVARHPTAVDRRISRTRCTSHMATTAFGKILADLGSRLLASARVTVSRIAWRPPSPPPPWRSPPGGHVPLPFGSPSLRSPLLQTMTSTPPTVRNYFAILTHVHLTFLTCTFTCLSGRLKTTRQWIEIRLCQSPLQPQPNRRIRQERRAAVVVLQDICVRNELILLDDICVMNCIIVNLFCLLWNIYIFCLFWRLPDQGGSQNMQC